MATINSLAVSRNLPIPGEGAGGGQEKTQYTEVTIPAGATTADVFNLFDIPRNSRIIGGKISVDALGGGTLNIGDTGTYINGAAVAASANRYMAAQAVTAAGVTTFTAQTGIFFLTGNGLASNRGRVRVQATLAAGPTTTAGVLRVNITYTTEEPQA